MTLLSSVLLGVVQGVTEFLPVSSSGHLAIAEHLLNVSGASSVPPFFDVLLHLGTLFAVFAAYWEDIRDMILEFFYGVGDLVHRTTPSRVPPARRMILLIIAGTLPLFAVLPIKDTIESLGDNMYFVAFALLAGATVAVTGKGDLMEVLVSALTTLAAGLLIADVLLPLCYKVGPERARPYLYALVFIPALGLFLVYRMGIHIDTSWLDRLARSSPAAVLGLFSLPLLAALALTFVSYLISCRVAAGKEY